MKKLKGMALIAILGASIVCMAASGGCGSDLHKAEISAGAIAAGLHTAATVNHSDTLEGDDERKVVAGYIVEAAAANSDFIGVLKGAESNGGTPNVAAIVTAFKGLTSRIDDLNTQGALHLKTPKAQSDFALAIAAIRTQLAVIQSLYPSTTATAERSRAGFRGTALAGVVLTGAEWEELIAMAMAAGSTLVPKLLALKGETGTQILEAADADDLAAEEISEEDGAAAPEADPDPEPAPTTK